MNGAPPAATATGFSIHFSLCFQCSGRWKHCLIIISPSVFSLHCVTRKYTMCLLCLLIYLSFKDNRMLYNRIQRRWIFILLLFRKEANCSMLSNVWNRHYEKNSNLPLISLYSALPLIENYVPKIPRCHLAYIPRETEWPMRFKKKYLESQFVMIEILIESPRTLCLTICTKCLWLPPN